MGCCMSLSAFNANKYLFYAVNIMNLLIFTIDISELSRVFDSCRLLIFVVMSNKTIILHYMVMFRIFVI